MVIIFQLSVTLIARSILVIAPSFLNISVTRCFPTKISTIYMGFAINYSDNRIVIIHQGRILEYISARLT